LSTATTIEDVMAGRARYVVVCADNRVVLPTLPDKSVDAVISDAPYSAHVHGKSRRGASLPDGRGERWHGESRGGDACLSRARDLGFESITPELMTACAAAFGRCVRRWVLEFCDDEIAGDWRAAFLGAGLQHIRVGHWRKVGCTPQFTGDRPGSDSEAIVIAHPPGRKRWNGGGTWATWTHPIALQRGDGTLRVHTTQKPESLMLELVSLFTDPDELILDPFCGSGTTGVAALRLGRRFIGIEMNETYAAVARERLEAETRGLSLTASRHGQTSIFDVINTETK
jgi:site-specific DNA-methyltransferase (adenine-specific)